MKNICQDLTHSESDVIRCHIFSLIQSLRAAKEEQLLAGFIFRYFSIILKDFFPVAAAALIRDIVIDCVRTN